MNDEKYSQFAEEEELLFDEGRPFEIESKDPDTLLENYNFKNLSEKWQNHN